MSALVAKPKTATNRMDAVFIRKSSKEQDDQGQQHNVRTMLKTLGVCVQERNWFVGTVSRRKVKANAEFNRLLEMVETDKIDTVYVESQDRWGTSDRTELFTLLGILREHNTHLFDLRARKDLTEKDFATEMMSIIQSYKSEKELQDISYRSLRTRVNNFKNNGSWPTGTHPYGYGKRCYSKDEKLLWEWQPIDRSKGQLFYPDELGELIPVAALCRIPRKDREDIIILVPSNNPAYVKAVKLVFDFYTRVGLSRRQISARLNAEGLTFNGGPFTHADVTNILRNPAYAGDTYFGKVQTGELHTFDSKGLITEVKSKRADKRRNLSECLNKKDTHVALVDRPTWELAQKKLASEQERVSFAPRNPAYYLKQLFVCGHCGKGMRGRMASNPDTKKKTVVYVCPTYIDGKCNGHPVTCGYHQITHSDAERLLLDKIKELDLEFDNTLSSGARANLQKRLARIGEADEKFVQQYQRIYHEGVTALGSYLCDVFGANFPETKELFKLAESKYGGDLDQEAAKTRHSRLRGYGNRSLGTRLFVMRSFGEVTLTVADVRKAVLEAEQATVKEAKRRLALLQEEHKTLTLNWVRASQEMQKVLKQEIDKLEIQIKEWEPRTVPISERFKVLYAFEAETRIEHQKLLAEWPSLESREKGEAMRRLFKSVTLFWERNFHPALAKPCRPRKTHRPGRYSYHLQRGRIQWALESSDLGSSW